jgi:hypothetical protein
VRELGGRAQVGAGKSSGTEVALRGGGEASWAGGGLRWRAGTSRAVEVGDAS